MSQFKFIHAHADSECLQPSTDNLVFFYFLLVQCSFEKNNEILILSSDLTKENFKQRIPDRQRVQRGRSGCPEPRALVSIDI